MTPIPDLELIRQLEEHLFDPAVRRTSQMVGMLLADDFFEFGRSGGVSTKHEVVRHLGSVLNKLWRCALIADSRLLEGSLAHGPTCSVA